MTAVMRVLATGLIVGVTAVALPASAAQACSCGELTIDEAFEQADAAFVGELIEIRRSAMTSTDAPTRFIFDVTSVLQGDVYKTQSIVSPASGASCGLDLPMDTAVIVYGRDDAHDLDGAMLEGEYFSTLCDGNAPLAPASVAFLGGVPPLAGSSPIGADASVVATSPWTGIAALAAAGGLAAVYFIARRRRTKQRAVGESGS